MSLSPHAPVRPEMDRKPESRRRRSVPVAVAALLATSMTVLGTAPASAGDCTYKERSTGGMFSPANVAVHTTLKNASSSIAYTGTITRGRGTPEIKKQATLQPGEQTGVLVKEKNPDGDAYMKVEFADVAGTTSYVCKYLVNSDETGTNWWPNLKANSDRTCPKDAPITCSKSYNPDKARWNTTFTIHDLPAEGAE